VSAGAPAPGTSAPGEQGGRLLRALQVYLQFVETMDRDAEALLRRHRDLQDLLEPMLRARASFPPPADARHDAAAD
jgi:hypothetical protein